MLKICLSTNIFAFFIFKYFNFALWTVMLYITFAQYCCVMYNIFVFRFMGHMICKPMVTLRSTFWPPNNLFSLLVLSDNTAADGDFPSFQCLESTCFILFLLFTLNHSKLLCLITSESQQCRCNQSNTRKSQWRSTQDNRHVMWHVLFWFNTVYL